MTIFRSDSQRGSLWRRVVRIVGIILALLVVLLGLRVLTLRSFDRTLPPKLAEIEKLPVSLPDGKRVSLRHLIRPGVPTLITLWATWCPPCRAEAPEIADLRKRFGPGSLNLVYLNVRDQFSSREEINEFMRTYGMKADDYAVLDDALIGKATNSNTNSIPRTMLFDRAGQPIGTITGYNPIALNRMEGLIGR